MVDLNNENDTSSFSFPALLGTLLILFLLFWIGTVDGGATEKGALRFLEAKGFTQVMVEGGSPTAPECRESATAPLYAIAVTPQGRRAHVVVCPVGRQYVIHVK